MLRPFIVKVSVLGYFALGIRVLLYTHIIIAAYLSISIFFHYMKYSYFTYGYVILSNLGYHNPTIFINFT